MTKQQLQEYYWLRKNIKKLEEKLLELDSEAKRVTVSYSAAKSRGTSNDKMANIISKIIEVQNQINKLTVQAYEQAMAIEKAILALPNRERYLIRLRYIEGLSWYEIMAEMHYSWKQVHRIHSEALKLLA